jgi:glycosyltransferase involved in cell wall biosynthesis
MNILFLPNWSVHLLATDEITIQSPDKKVNGCPYWFFQYFPEHTHVDIIDIRSQNILHAMEKKIKFYLWQAVLAIKKDHKYDVVISHGAQSGLFYSLLNVFRKKKNRPLHIIIDVGGFNGGRTHKIETTLVKFALKSHPAIIYHSSIQKDLYETLYKGIIRQISFIRFGVNIKEFYPLNQSADNYVLSFGYDKRDYPTLLKAWDRLDTDTRLYIIGVKTIRTETEKQIVSLPRTDILTLKQYIAKSLFVVIPLPFYKYSYGQMTVLQSMAMGKPVIVTKTPSTVDYIEDGKGVFFVNPYDDIDLKNKIQYLLQHQKDLEAIGMEARSYVQNELNEEKMADGIYKTILRFLKDNRK